MYIYLYKIIYISINFKFLIQFNFKKSKSSEWIGQSKKTVYTNPSIIVGN